MKFNVFGSKSSIDRDVLVYVDVLPSLEGCKKLSKTLDAEISDLYVDGKEVNTNLGVVNAGVLIHVFKGSVDEVNNSLLATYSDHEQKFPLMISRRLDRDLGLKVLRAARIILSLCSRTQYRPEVKISLSGNLINKIDTLKQLDFLKIIEFGKNGSNADVHKNIAFQLGQVLGLCEGKEFYSKESIWNAFPGLKPMLARNPLCQKDLNCLNSYKNKFVELTEKMLPSLAKLVE